MVLEKKLRLEQYRGWEQNQHQGKMGMIVYELVHLPPEVQYLLILVYITMLKCKDLVG